MTGTNLSVLLLFLLVMAMGCLLTAAVQYARCWLQRRFAAIEDSLRTYNTANVAIGRHMTALENELGELRKRMALLEHSGRGRMSGARPRGTVAGAPCEEFSEAELRLAQRLKAGLGSLRLG